MGHGTHTSGMSVLSKEELRAALAADPPLVEGIEIDVQLQTNGIDLRVERVQRLSSPGLLGATDAVREPAAREDVQSDNDGWWDLHRGAYVIAYREKANLPHDLMALADGRTVKLCRCGHSATKAFCDGTHRRVDFVSRPSFEPEPLRERMTNWDDD